MSAAPIELHWVQQPGTRMRSLRRPTTVLTALQLLETHPELRPVAGGTDLVLDLARSGRGGEVDLLDLTRIDGFSTLDFDVDAEPGRVTIGAGVTHADILYSSLAAERLLPLAQACLEVGSPQLRNRATIVGNLVTASPANDTISALMALGALVVIARLDDGIVVERAVPLTEFYAGFRSTVLAPGELVVRLTVAQPTPTQRAMWVKVGLRKAQAISVVHAGFSLDFDADGVVTVARIALGSIAPTVVLNEPAAAALVGSSLTPASIARAADAAADSIEPIDDGRATAAYRTESVRVIVARALRTLAAGAERERWPHRIPLLSNRARLDAEQTSQRPDSSPRPEVREVSVTVNGEPHTLDVVGTGTLLDWLRETAGPGTKEGCAEGECGACTVDLDGEAVMACLVPATQADGAAVRTIEGLGTEADVHPMKQAFVEKFAVQCGYCIPGFIMAAQSLAREFETPPTRAEVEHALSGNLCRCTGYYNIIDAVLAAIDGTPRDPT